MPNERCILLQQPSSLGCPLTRQRFAPPAPLPPGERDGLCVLLLTRQCGADRAFSATARIRPITVARGECRVVVALSSSNIHHHPRCCQSTRLAALRNPCRDLVAPSPYVTGEGWGGGGASDQLLLSGSVAPFLEVGARHLKSDQSAHGPFAPLTRQQRESDRLLLLWRTPDGQRVLRGSIHHYPRKLPRQRRHKP